MSGFHKSIKNEVLFGPSLYHLKRPFLSCFLASKENDSRERERERDLSAANFWTTYHVLAANTNQHVGSHPSN